MVGSTCRTHNASGTNAASAWAVQAAEIRLLCTSALKGRMDRCLRALRLTNAKHHPDYRMSNAIPSSTIVVTVTPTRKKANSRFLARLASLLLASRTTCAK